MIGQNGSGHDYWSNQFLGGLPVGTGNLGGDEAGGFTGEGAINMQNFAGDQFFTVPVVPVPEPSTYAAGIAVLLAGVIAIRHRRVALARH
jgi:hypothetical protein